MSELKDIDGFWYVATPYSKWRNHDAAARIAAIYAGRMMRKGMKIYSPIAHGHFISYCAPRIDKFDHAFWMEQCRPFMKAAHGLIVVIMEGWDVSVGVQMEIDAFRAMRKPIICYVPETDQFIEGEMRWLRLD